VLPREFSKANVPARQEHNLQLGLSNVPTRGGFGAHPAAHGSSAGSSAGIECRIE
jgi:hypothetical protein